MMMMISLFNRAFIGGVVRRSRFTSTTSFEDTKRIRFELFTYGDIEGRIGEDCAKAVRRLGGINKFKTEIRKDHERDVPNRVLELVETRGISGECPKYEVHTHTHTHI